MTRYSDHFSTGARDYAAFRPDYPDALLDAVTALAPGRALAWDCGTGSGQAALPLAGRFARVVATDASEQQIAHARPHPRVEYRVAREDASGLPDGSADLVTVAQALHWFDLDRFYAEVRRVLRPGGVLAAWSYGLMLIDAPVDAAVRTFYDDRLGRYWPPERRHVDAGYRDLPFPFPAVPSGAWSMTGAMTRDELLGYVGTWSAVTRCRAAEGADPLTELARALEPLWPDRAERRTVTWPIALRVGRRP
jgi:SAM-dependent methyltransferase